MSIVIEPISIPISKFAKSSGKVTDLSRISLSNFNESQLTKNQSIEWNMYESKGPKVHEVNFLMTFKTKQFILF